MTHAGALRGRLIRATSLSRQEWSLVAIAWLMLLVVELGLKLLPLRNLLSALARLPLSKGWKRIESQRVAELVGLATRHHPLQPRCLRTATVLKILLGNRRGSAMLVLGFAQPGLGFAAHAWVEEDGVALGEGSNGYQPLALL